MTIFNEREDDPKVAARAKKLNNALKFADSLDQKQIMGLILGVANEISDSLKYLVKSDKARRDAESAARSGKHIEHFEHRSHDDANAPAI